MDMISADLEAWFLRSIRNATALRLDFAIITGASAGPE